MSKVGTQLLRWGRSDVVQSNGSVLTIVLPGWETGSWVELGRLARVMEVDPELSRELLHSTGRHGECVLFEEGTDRVKAAWKK